ncbi:hypothetical protein CHARACLAT_014740 [Characodon lateralis]|uniref:Uncharacterized protein n=1 Tax=Characodon lateralis TaxID=208331 RepID=A0ABU7DSR2_9TELE|nr:hypothetical protein [Characodon lateralis]
MHCIMENLSMQETSRYAQVVSETRVHSDRAEKGKVKALNIQTENRPNKKRKVSPQVMQQNQGGGNWRQPKDKPPVKRQTPFHRATLNCKVGGKEWSHSKDVITKEEFEMICRCVITEVTAFLKDMASRCSPESTL